MSASVSDGKPPGAGNANAEVAAGPAPSSPGNGKRTVMLIMATLGFALNFWAWALLTPLAPQFKDVLGLTPFQQALIVAVPVIVGSLGRIPVGALTDKYGARLMFPIISLLSVVAVLYLGIFGQKSLTTLLVGGFFLGIAGTAFAIGVPFVNGWFPPQKRGLAIGLFGVGMGGTAISALTTVNLAKAWGDHIPFVVAAVVLVVYAIAAGVIMREPPAWKSSSVSIAKRLGRTMKLGVTWYASILYAITFGGYVAFSVYLVAYLGSAYELDKADAAYRLAGFVIVAVALRPVGGWLSDKIGPGKVFAAVFVVVAAAAAVQSTTPELMPIGTISFMAMAGALGAGAGATFSYVAMLAPGNAVGAVTGFVGAAGGLGGFVPPLIMGAAYGAFGSYALGLLLLAGVCVLLLLFTLTKVRHTLAEHAEEQAARPRPAVT